MRFLSPHLAASRAARDGRFLSGARGFPKNRLATNDRRISLPLTVCSRSGWIVRSAIHRVDRISNWRGRLLIGLPARRRRCRSVALDRGAPGPRWGEPESVSGDGGGQFGGPPRGTPRHEDAFREPPLP